MLGTQSFREKFQELGREVQAKITTTINGVETVYSDSDIVTVRPSYEGGLFRTIMREIEVELDGVTEIGETFEVSIGVKLAGDADYETVTVGKFIVSETERSDENNSLIVKGYDDLLLSMVTFDLQLDYAANPITVLGLLQAICIRLDYTLGTTEFANSDKVIPSEPYTQEYTYRDVLDDIAEVAGGGIVIKPDGKLYIVYPTDSGEVVAADNMRSITIGEKFGGVNSLVISRQPQNDNIYIMDTDDINENGLTEIRIDNNQLFEAWRTDAENHSTTTADEAKAALFDAIKGLSYFYYEYDSFGFGFFEPYDKAQIQTLDGKKYPIMYLICDVEIGQGVKETSKLEADDKETTDYRTSSETDRMVNQTYLRVNKADQVIEELITKTEKIESEVAGNTESITNTLERIDTAEASILNINKTLAQGVTEVTTTTGFTFNADGLTVTNSESKTKSTVDSQGLTVKEATDAGETLLFAGVDSVTNESIVETKNLTVKKYLVIGKHARFEDYLENRTACFYIS